MSNPALQDALRSTEAAARLARFGPNVPAPRRRAVLVVECLARVRNPLVILLTFRNSRNAVAGS